MRRILRVLLLGGVLGAIAAAATDLTVVQKDRAFSIRQLTAKVGDQVTFVNNDTVNHNVYSETKGLEFDFVQRPGRSDTVRFTQPGVAEVSCAIHPVMKLQIQVKP